MIPSHFQKFIPTLKRILPYVEMLSLLALALYLLFKESYASEIVKVLTVLLSSVSLLYILVSTKQWETTRETFIHKATYQIFAVCAVSTLFSILNYPGADKLTAFAFVSSMLLLIFNLIDVYILKKSNFKDNNLLLRMILIYSISFYNYFI